MLSFESLSISKLSRCFAICCLQEILLLRNGLILSSIVRSLKRRQEHRWKLRDFQKARWLSTLISKKIKESINHVQPDCWSVAAIEACDKQSSFRIWRNRNQYIVLHLWKVLTYGLFIHVLTLVSCVLDEGTNVTHYSREECRLLTEITNVKGFDDMSSLILKRVVVYIADALPFSKQPFAHISTLDCWKPVIVAPIPKPKNSNITAKRLRLIAITSCDVMLAELAICRRPTSFVSGPGDHLKLACNPNRSAVDSVISVVHYINKSLDASSRSIRCAFIDFCLPLRSVVLSSS